MKKRTLPRWWLFIIGSLLLPMGCLTDPSGIATVDVSPTTPTLSAIGDTVQFTYVARDSGGDRVGVELHWSSGPEQVATVDKYTGLATAVANGTAIICAGNLWLPGRWGCATLTVAAP